MLRTEAITDCRTSMPNVLSEISFDGGYLFTERYSGMVARYENNKLGSDRVRLRFEFEDFRNQWNSATQSVAEAGGLYRARQNFQPEVTFQLSRPLTLTVGASFERMQDAFAPSQTESANSIVSSLRYHRRLEGAESRALAASQRSRSTALAGVWPVSAA